MKYQCQAISTLKYSALVEVLGVEEALKISKTHRENIELHTQQISLLNKRFLQCSSNGTNEPVSLPLFRISSDSSKPFEDFYEEKQQTSKTEKRENDELKLELEQQSKHQDEIIEIDCEKISGESVIFNFSR